MSSSAAPSDQIATAIERFDFTRTGGDTGFVVRVDGTAVAFVADRADAYRPSSSAT